MLYIIKNILTNVLSSLYTEFFESLLFAFLFAFFYEYAKKHGGYKKAVYDFYIRFKSNKDDRIRFYFMFYIAMTLFRTLLGRSLWINTLSDVFGSWTLYDSNGHLYTEGIENIILFLPLCYLYFALPEKRNYSKNRILFAIQFSFLLSLAIEFSQLFLKLGSFQLSDIAFNTLGGFLGGLLYVCLHHKKNNEQRRR